MSTPSGITRAGLEAEHAFCAATGATRCPKSALGDAVLDRHYIEIKAIASDKSWTLNQVRAVKYITLVVHHRTTDGWYVVPALEIVRQVARRTRGQHTENPFESVNLSLRAFAHCRIDGPSDLRAATLAAIAVSDSRPDVRDAMAQILGRSRQLADESLAEVRRLLAP